MRQLLSSVALSTLLAAGARAQAVSGSEGALFLLLPTGAQAVGMGQAMVAARPGSEGIWWNPASIAADDKRELAIHHSKTVAGVGDALSFVLPTASHGTGALSINILNLGEQQVTDDLGGVIGVILPRDVVFAASYATRVAKRLSAGLNYKLIQLRVDCSGQCSSVGAAVQSSRAVDLGTQYEIAAGAPLAFGAAIRNLGGKLNSRATNQRDPLPTQVEFGAMYRFKFLDHYVKDTELRASGSFVDSRSFGGKSVRFGSDVMYQEKVHLRAGYVGHDRRGDASASLGFGLQSGGFIFDIARTFGGLPADNGQSPVYVSLRYLF
ncbi:MAG TPA: PorV/PorQ family protein [Gemmatimonadaceae bacterium]|nr:PorV/PorQ family protein [Gemmatimonadaceae bacterium]